jgi:maleylpyruvate isomerase
MSTELLPPDVAGQLALVDQATDGLLAALDQPGLQTSRPSLCAGWTAGHILTHLARNADGLRRSAAGARRGERVAMYDSAEARNRDIETGAARPMAQLIADVTGSAAALREEWSMLGDGDWAREMPHHRVGLLPVSASPMMRLNEVLIHNVDLDWAYRATDWPDAFVAGIITRAAGGLAGRLPDEVAVDVRVTDTGQELSAGSGTVGRVRVSGPAWAVAAWVAGRPAPARPALSVTGGGLPELASWP